MTMGTLLFQHSVFLWSGEGGHNEGVRPVRVVVALAGSRFHSDTTANPVDVLAHSNRVVFCNQVPVEMVCGSLAQEPFFDCTAPDKLYNLHGL
ncbi:hypothetical protein AVEN_29713-1 [Araneus ventricosus]|uniref:Uncharacterized protein n=1 Tax=Araneus ventricosus TaxID=182803 RepID=A0A4Y2NZW9_ARAVE|nr:hypothetical protein AVEN_29713-1 [Araneus ventricosus]